VGAVADPVAHLALALGLLLVAARLGGEIAARLKAPEVLGELCAGMALRLLPGTGFFRDLATDPAVDVLARLGALVLLFDAGLALAVRDVVRVGGAAARVALLGTVASFALGLGAASLLLPGAPVATRAFLAGALTATSVGISARVLKDLGRSRTVEARTVLGAAVIDDVIGLLVLSLVSGWAAGGASGLRAGGVAILLVKTAAFFGVALTLGPRFVARLLAAAARLTTRRALVVVGLAFCFLLAWAADALGLAPIVGAFTAGLVLEEAHWRAFVDRGERGLDEEIEPLNAFLVPLFFTLLGLRTDLRVFADPSVLALALGLTLAAVLGKLACGLGAARGTRGLAVSFGMMPRGEVSLVFASLGLSLGVGGRPVLDHRAYSALVMMVVLTTLVTPAGLTASFGPRSGEPPSAPRSRARSSSNG
jgi:Kef-type K+ transport system membrane component KefB